MKNDIDCLAEWAVWAHLDSETNLELILLKGHLLIETILEAVLLKNNIGQDDNFSFYRKTNELEKISFRETIKKDVIINSLKEVNRLRNKLAHEFNFEISSGDLELWGKNILDNLKGTKHTKFTQRTKIVHAFSILAINILELQ